MQSESFQEVSLAAVTGAMKVVRDYQLGRRKLIEGAEVKAADNTLVTWVDGHSEKLMNASLANTPFGQMPSVFEELGEKAGTGDEWVGGDGIDGTGAFVYGLPTSTIILYHYSSLKKKVLAYTIGEPATGRIWQSTENGALVWDTYKDLPTSRAMTVWDGEPQWTKLDTGGNPKNNSCCTFMDILHGFTRGGRQILTNRQNAQLAALLGARSKLLVPGSNGLIQALVAMGNERVCGGITTALGGPQDAAGVSMVIAAGGCAKAYAVVDSKLVEKDPLDPFSYDCACYANNQETLQFLVSSLKSVFA